MLRFGGPRSIRARIGDAKFYNNIYNGVAEWSLVYLNSCAGISCTNLNPNICYAECDQWCKSESEWFLPILQPTLYSFTPYLNILDSYYETKYDDIYFGINVPTNGWSDYSVTGWVQFPVCHHEETTFFKLEYPFFATALDISLTDSSLSNHCDTLKVTIYSSDGLNYAFSSAVLSSLSYIKDWFFFATTVNSGSKLLTFYSHIK